MTTLKFFQAEWCGPCKQQKPIVADLDDDRSDVTVEHLDVEDDTDEANRYQVRSVPTIVVVDDDEQVVDRFTGLTQRTDLEAALPNPA